MKGSLGSFSVYTTVFLASDTICLLILDESLTPSDYGEAYLRSRDNGAFLPILWIITVTSS